jgi:hypothetical protein
VCVCVCVCVRARVRAYVALQKSMNKKELLFRDRMINYSSQCFGASYLVDALQKHGPLTFFNHAFSYDCAIYGWTHTKETENRKATAASTNFCQKDLSTLNWTESSTLRKLQGSVRKNRKLGSQETQEPSLLRVALHSGCQVSCNSASRCGLFSLLLWQESSRKPLWPQIFLSKCLNCVRVCVYVCRLAFLCMYVCMYGPLEDIVLVETVGSHADVNAYVTYVLIDISSIFGHPSISFTWRDVKTVLFNTLFSMQSLPFIFFYRQTSFTTPTEPSPRLPCHFSCLLGRHPLTLLYTSFSMFLSADPLVLCGRSVFITQQCATVGTKIFN